ncbi:MAG: LacI family DNA-binding transcriptional regulator [Streptosporangiales bacterium]|nr:LacI family DNA-binding transcriptional regulator [Streptosporangiales bacterium]
MTTLSTSRSRARPTMADVARRAGVSLKTVSRVVNDEPGVHTGTVDRVRKAIEELNYRRNDGASLLRRGAATASIGLVVEDLADPFYSAVAAGVEQTARLRGHLLLTGSGESDPRRAHDLALAFCARQVDGLIIVPAADDHSWLQPEVDRGTPVVFVDRPGTGCPADVVVVDNDGGIKAAVSHLANQGHRRIAFLGDDPAFWTAQRRRAAFKRSMAARRLSVRDMVAMGPHEPFALADRVRTWLELADPVTAVVAGNNRISATLLRVLAAMDRRDLAVVGFDDFELADLLDPPVTVVAQDPTKIGQQAASVLFARLDGDSGPPRHVVLPTRLVPRGSGEVPPWHPRENP